MNQKILRAASAVAPSPRDTVGDWTYNAVKHGALTLQERDEILVEHGSSKLSASQLVVQVQRGVIRNPVIA